MAKFIFVTGGVVSGLGKGITAASLGRPRKGPGLDGPPAQVPRTEGRQPEAGPLCERGPGYHEPPAAR